MKAFRFDATASVQWSGIKRDADLKRASGMKQASGTRQDTGFARPRKARTENPVGKIGHRAPTVHA